MSKLDITHITESNGNVFADLGFPQEEAIQLKESADSLIIAKRRLMESIALWIKENDYKQSQVAELLGVSRPRISDVVNYKTEKFTVDTLINMVNKTGHNVSFTIL